MTAVFILMGEQTVMAFYLVLFFELPHCIDKSLYTFHWQGVVQGSAETSY
jgi:hypothetical protein